MLAEIAAPHACQMIWFVKNVWTMQEDYSNENREAWSPQSTHVLAKLNLI